MSQEVKPIKPSKARRMNKEFDKLYHAGLASLSPDQIKDIDDKYVLSGVGNRPDAIAKIGAAVLGRRYVRHSQSAFVRLMSAKKTVTFAQVWQRRTSTSHRDGMSMPIHEFYGKGIKTV